MHSQISKIILSEYVFITSVTLRRDLSTLVLCQSPPYLYILKVSNLSFVNLLVLVLEIGAGSLDLTHYLKNYVSHLGMQ